MKKVLLIAIATWLVGFQVKSQDSFAYYQLNLFSDPKEKLILMENQDDPFFLLQAVNILEDVRVTKNWEELTKVLDQKMKREVGDVRMLYELFFTTHQLMLKDYAKHANFSNTLTDGVYDCVTGTGLFALVLDRYQIPYDIVETDEHVYIKGLLDKMPFIIESTFPKNGLITGAKQIMKFERQFLPNGNKSDQSISTLSLGKLNESPHSSKMYLNYIGLKELAGLQYYNDAIKKFDDKEYQNAYKQLIKAAYLYPSPRINDLKSKMMELLGVVSVEFQMQQVSLK
ncbi:hypothetical protein [Cecembia rubra]|uniref:hypothetical protein n=1 Tax=Cecembia rubra TaxID=1485585 RepID=UPI002714BF90|nr:hypothetical protein [Cecembia rubra]